MLKNPIKKNSQIYRSLLREEYDYLIMPECMITIYEVISKIQHKKGILQISVEKNRKKIIIDRTI